MKTNITIGQYYPTKSVIHSLDPRLKIIITLLYIIVLFMVKNASGYLIAIVFLGFTIIESKVPFKLLIKGLKGILYIIIFSLVLNLLFTANGNVIFKIGFIKITDEGVALSLKMVLRLVMLVIGSSVLTLTTSPIELTDGIEFLLKPLKKIGVPAHEIAMMITITLRFIPTLLEELDKIIKAQKARGADFETGSIFKRAKSLVPIIVPLLLSSFRRAEELATAMEARCYRGDYNRTRMKEMKFSKNDFYSASIFFTFTVIIILTRYI